MCIKFEGLFIIYLINFLYYAVTLSKAAILGITLGALVILLMILLAACRPHNPSPFPDGSLEKPGDKSSNSSQSSYPGGILKY